MILDLDDLPSGSTLQADLCIVGAGIAGLLLADALRDTPLQILVLESGGCRDEAASQALTDADCAGWPHRGSSEGCFRLLGGSSTRWGGQLLPLTPHDFAVRPHVPGSGWPIDATTLVPYLQRIEALMGVNHRPFAQAFGADCAASLLGLDGDQLQLRYSKWAPFSRRNLARTLGRRLAAHPRVRLLLHANVTAIVGNNADARVRGVRARSLSGRHCVCQAAQLVLSCGTIETVRLLLASSRVDPQGLALNTALLGRYFHDHLSVPLCRLEGQARRFCLHHFAPWYSGRTRHTPKLEATASWQQRTGGLNTMAHLVFTTPPGSPIAWARRQLQCLQGHAITDGPPPAPRRVLHDSVDLLALGWRSVVQRRRWAPRSAALHLTIDSEQAPQACSRIELSDRCNALGEPLARVCWHWGQTERQSMQQFAGLLNGQWQRWGLGQLAFGADWHQGVHDTLHPMGGTRMALSPRDGVVDAQLRVHGIPNLYVASCSVFPTGGSSNPTLTLMALCLRLADHLRRQP